MDPVTAALLAGGISGLGSIFGGALSKQGSQETAIQKTQRNVIDQILQSVRGQGPFSDLFQTDEEAFNRSFRDPALSQFRNVTAPQIQQSYIASGQQRGTGLEDTLTRAGVDLQSNLDQLYFNYLQGGQDRQLNALNAILGMGAGAAPEQSFGSALGQAAGGYLSQPGFKDDLDAILQAFDQRNEPAKGTATGYIAPRRGYSA